MLNTHLHIVSIAIRSKLFFHSIDVISIHMIVHFIHYGLYSFQYDSADTSLNSLFSFKIFIAIYKWRKCTFAPLLILLLIQYKLHKHNNYGITKREPSYLSISPLPSPSPPLASLFSYTLPIP